MCVFFFFVLYCSYVIGIFHCQVSLPEASACGISCISYCQDWANQRGKLIRSLNQRDHDEMLMFRERWRWINDLLDIYRRDNFQRMNIHLPAILGLTRGIGFPPPDHLDHPTQQLEGPLRSNQRWQSEVSYITII